MTRTFNFRFYDGRTINEIVPIMNGCVKSNDFMPDFIKQVPFCLSIALQDLNEFNADCQNIVDEISTNRWQYNADTTYYYALKAIVRQHINNYGRLFFSDLTSYVDDCCLLMKGLGFDVYRLKADIYLQLLFLIIQEFEDYIKDGNPVVGVILFTSTSKYTLLLQNMKS